MRHAALRASLVVGLLALPAAILPVGAAQADGTITCTTYIGPGTYQGSLVVSSGETCLTDATVTGSVVVRPGASVKIEDSSVDGAVNSNGATDISVCGSILGSLSVLNSIGPVVIGRAGEQEGCTGNTINGSVTLQGNHDDEVVLGANTIAGSVNFLGNIAATNAVEGNQIGGSLVCLRNDAPPIKNNYPNTVGAATVGQCANLNPSPE